LVKEWGSLNLLTEHGTQRACLKTEKTNFTQSRGTRLREDDADGSKHVAVLKIYKILFIYIYIFCAFLGLDNKLPFGIDRSLDSLESKLHSASRTAPFHGRIGNYSHFYTRVEKCRRQREIFLSLLP